MAQKNLHTVQQILNSIRAAAYVINSETHEILFVNKTAKYLSGGKLKPGKKCWEVLQNNQSAPCSFCKLDKLKTFPQGKTIEWKFQNTVNHRWYKLHDQLIEWEDGQLALLEIAYDIHDAEMKKRRHLWPFDKEETVFNAFPYYTSVYELSSSQKVPIIREFNDPGAALHGYLRHELIGKPISMLDTPATKSKIEERIQNLIATGSLQFTTEHFRKDGTILKLQVDARYVEQNGEKLIYSVCQDISSRESLLNKVMESEKKYKLLSSLTSDAIFVYHVSNNGNIVTDYVGGNIKGLTGYAYEDINKIGGRDALVLTEDLSKLKKQKEYLLANKPFSIQYRIKRKDGKIVWLDDVAFSLWDENEKRVTVIYNSIRDITAEMEGKLELAEREKKYKELYDLLKTMSDNAADMIWAKDMDNNFTFVNEVVAKNLLNANDTDEPLGKNEIVFVLREREKHPERKDWFTFGEECSNSDEAVKQSGKPGHFFEYGNVMGNYLYLDVYKSPIFDNSGKMIGTVGFARDITQMKQYETELKNTADKFRKYLNLVPVAIFSMDNKGFLKEVNPAFEKLTGLTDKLLIGRNVKEFVYKKNHDSFNKGLKELIERGTAKGEGIFHVGKRLQKVLSYHGIKLDDHSYLGVVFDITAQKHAHEVLKLNEQRYRTVFEDLPNIAVQAYDKNRNVIFWNDTSTRFFGYSKKEALGKKFEDLIIPDEKKAWTKRKVTDWLRGNMLTKPGEYQRKRKDGSIFMVYSSFIQIVNYHGEKEFFSLDIDLSAIKKAENKLKETLAALEESNKTKDKIFSIIGHDLRSPFNSLLGFTELLLEQFYDFDDEEKYNMVEVLRKNSIQAFNLLNNILEWSRQQMGKISYQPGVVFIRPVADEVIGFLTSIAQEKKILLLNNITPRHFAFCDRGLVSVILRNLVSNAIKFSPEGEKVQIESFVENNRLWISVKDNGVGIKKEDIEKILLFQGEFTSQGTKGEKGTGLGLMLCRDFIKMNHGTLKITSVPGEGSNFQFSLPQNNG